MAVIVKRRIDRLSGVAFVRKGVPDKE